MPKVILVSSMAIHCWNDKKVIFTLSNISHLSFRITVIIQTNILDLCHLDIQR